MQPGGGSERERERSPRRERASELWSVQSGWEEREREEREEREERGRKERRERARVLYERERDESRVRVEREREERMGEWEREWSGMEREDRRLWERVEVCEWAMEGGVGRRRAWAAREEFWLGERERWRVWREERERRDLEFGEPVSREDVKRVRRERRERDRERGESETT